MIYLLSLLFFLILCGLYRLLHLGSESADPLLVYKHGDQLVETVLKFCPIFNETYMPTLLWGKSGHLQTIVYAKLGRVKSPFPQGERQKFLMSDGATMTYDIFPPHKEHKSKGDYTMVICPGIANSSESTYICTFVNYAQEHGFRVAVLNHLGALSSVPLTSPRMFTYGCTDEYHMMIADLQRKYPDTTLMGIGFSMGANIVLKYAAEEPERQKDFLCLMSICQGYSASQAVALGSDWEHLRRAYAHAMTANQKKLVKRHYNTLLHEDIVAKHNLDTEKIFESTTLLEFDESYSRRRAGYKNVQEYYNDASCCNYIHNLHLPMFILNADDDPLVPPPLVNIAKKHAANNDNCLLAVTKHGGHLGYFEKGIITPASITWLDRAIIQYAEAMILMHTSGQLKQLQKSF